MINNNPSSFIPNIEIKPMSDNLWHEASYIPGVSTIKGAYNVLAATIKTVTAVALLIIGSIIIWTSPLVALVSVPSLRLGNLFSEWILLGLALVGHACALTFENGEAAGLFDSNSPFAYTPAIDQFGRGILELIPVAGNLGLGFLDGRIQINPELV